MRLNDHDPLSEVLTIAQAADEIGRAAATLRDWVRQGRLRPLKIPGSRRTWTTARDVREVERTIFLQAQERNAS